MPAQPHDKTPDQSQDRTRLMRAIFATRKQLGLDEEDAWRGRLSREIGKDSLRAMRVGELRQLLSALSKDLPEDARRRPNGRVRPGTVDNEAINKLRALWISLAQLQIVRDRTDGALLAWIERQTGKAAFAHLLPRETAKLIEALEDWAEREGWRCKRLSLRAIRENLLTELWRRYNEASGTTGSLNDACQFWSDSASSIVGLSDPELKKAISQISRALADQIAENETETEAGGGHG